MFNSPAYAQQDDAVEQYDMTETFSVAPENYTLSGPFESDNLTVFLIHGEDKMRGKNVLTLEEAMAQRKVSVYETSNVNLLTIKNLSDETIFLQSGDIVKGGRQDRTLQYDMIISGGNEIPLPAFCVEKGRWAQRQNESTQRFSTSCNYVSGKHMKLASKYKRCQNEVWQSVDTHQRMLSKAAGFSSADLQSSTSLDLTMDSKPVTASIDAHMKDLSKIIKNKADVIGYAFAINGQINSADVYASNALFKKLWNKLLKSTAVEAVAEKSNTQNEKGKKASNKDVLEFLIKAQQSPARRKYVTAESVMLEQEQPDSLLYRTQWCNAKADNGFIHCNFLVK